MGKRHTAAVRSGKYASKAEEARAAELRLLERAGEICGLEEHPRFKLRGFNGAVVKHYTADFRYISGGREYVEDVKGRKFRDWPMTEKLFRDNYPSIRFRVIRRTRSGWKEV